MKVFDVVILTDSKHSIPSVLNPNIKNAILEDALLQNELTALGLKTARVSWDNNTFNWQSTKLAIFRSTWDYQDRYIEFSEWLSRTSKDTRLVNSEKIIKWNVDKIYLKDLENKGIHIAETQFLARGTKATLKEIHSQLGWTETVLKPCISAGGRHTYRMNLENLDAHESIFKKLIANEAMMLQPFQYNIVEKGEISMMVFIGKFTHAILKKAKSGDFRVQDDFGGIIYNYTPSVEEIDFAIKCVNACEELPQYARVDIFTDNNGKIALSELELIEPELWFRECPKAATMLANGINEILQRLD